MYNIIQLNEKELSELQSIAKELGIDVVQINPLDSDFIHQFNILADALSQ